MLSTTPDKIRVTPPKWWTVKKRLFTVACGAPRGVFTLAFQPSFKIRIGRFEEIIKQIFSTVNSATIESFPMLNLSSSESKFRNQTDPKSPILMPGAKFTQPATIEVRMPNHSPAGTR